MIYGHDKTIHSTEHLDVETHNGKVVAVWFRCAMLPFEQAEVDGERARSMLATKEQLPRLNAVDVTHSLENPVSATETGSEARQLSSQDSSQIDYETREGWTVRFNAPDAHFKARERGEAVSPEDFLPPPPPVWRDPNPVAPKLPPAPLPLPSGEKLVFKSDGKMEVELVGEEDDQGEREAIFKNAVSKPDPHRLSPIEWIIVAVVVGIVVILITQSWWR